MTKKKFLFCSPLALYPPLLRVAEIIMREYGLEGHVIAPIEFAGSPVYSQNGRISAKDFNVSATPLQLHFLQGQRDNLLYYGFEWSSLRRLLRDLKPDFIWIHEEFCGAIAQQVMWYYRFRRNTRMIAYAAINHVPKAPPLFKLRWPFFSRTRFKQLLLWPRLDGLAACATKSLECARRQGLPPQVPGAVNYLPVFGPEEAVGEAIELPWPRKDAFIIGFAGTITEQKGWKVLLKAVELLPENFKVVLVGDGDQRQELEDWLQRPGLKDRSYFTGPLPKERLLATYPLFHVFVLPSITTAASVEQFGAVLGEAMACGVPIIGSSSGAIPETVGEAGLIVPEGNPKALAKAIVHMSEDESLRHRSVIYGKTRFLKYFTCEVYAHSLAKLLFSDHPSGISNEKASKKIN